MAEELAKYSGDVLWALMIFLFVGFLFPAMSTSRAAMLAIAFSFSIELSQLYQAPWINSIRNTTLGGLVLGFGFLWSDLVCYVIGVGLGALLERCFLKSLQSLGWLIKTGELYGRKRN